MVSEDVKQHEKLKKKRETCTQRCDREGCNDDDVELNVLGCRVDILGTNCDQCISMVQCCFTSTKTVRLIRTGRGAQDGHLDSHTAPVRALPNSY